MKVSCPSCQTNYNIDDKRIPAGGAKLKCAKCQTMFPIKPGGATPPPADAVPLPAPGSGASGAVPLPAPSVTSSSAVPLPAPGSFQGAVPLPPPGSFGEVPLPPPTPGAAVPLPPPGSFGALPLPPPSSGTAVPLPGGGAIPLPRPSSIPLPRSVPGGATPLPPAAVPLPPPPSAGAIPLPPPSGGAIPLPPPSVGAIPLPPPSVGAIPLPSPSGGAIPLPSPSSGAVPLPGGSGAVPLPGGDVPWDDDGAVPLPGGGEGGWSDVAVSGEDDWSDVGTRQDAAVEVDFADAGDVDFADASEVELADDGAFSLEEPPTRGYAFGFDPGAEPVEAPPAPAPTPPPAVPAFDFGAPLTGSPAPSGFDFGALPAPGDAPAPAFDFGALPDPQGAGPAPDFDFGAPSGGGFDFGAPIGSAASAPEAVAPGLDFGDLPAAAGAPSFDFGDLPSPGAAPDLPGFDLVDAPAAPAPSFDFADLPTSAPAAPAFDFGDLPAPSAPAFDFGAPLGGGSGTNPDFDFGTHPPGPADVGAFSNPDPSVDFGAVDLGGGGPALDFGVAPAPASPSVAPGTSGYSVRRRSGKVFGPFEPDAIVQMLQDGQLLGNEDVSSDGERWEPIGAQEPFASVIQRMMSSAGGQGARPAAANRPSAPPPNLGTPIPARSAALEGRMAAVAIAEHDDEPPRASRAGRFAAIGVGLVLFLAVAGGIGLGFTPYGYFGLKKLLPAQVKPGTPEGAALQAVHQALLSGTRAELTSARDGAAKVLAIKEFPELRAAWGQAVFALYRHYGEGSPAERSRARAAIPEVAISGEGQLYLVKLRAAEALDARQGARARELVQSAGAANQEDGELLLTLAEAQWMEKDLAKAKVTATRVLEKHKDSARTHHLLGLLALDLAKAREAETLAAASQLASVPASDTEQHAALTEKRDAAREATARHRKEAADAFRSALAVNARHLLSAVTLASLELADSDNPKGALTAIEPTLAPEAAEELSSFLQAEALSIAGTAHLELNDEKSAEEALRKALDADPDHGRAQAALGRIFFKRRNYEDALPLFQAVSRRDPQNLEASEGLISALLATGKHDAAREAVEAANTRFMGSAGIAYLFGRVEDALGNALEAETHYKRALNAQPELHEAALYLARFYLRARRVPEAKALLEAPLRAEKLTPLMRVASGELALAEGQLDAAQADFSAALEASPDLADGYFGRSRTLLERGDLRAALADVEKALSLNPSLPEARLQLGVVLWKDGKVDQALEELKRAREEAPNSVPTAIALGKVQLDKELLAEAEKTLREALRSEPSNPEALVTLGRTLAARGIHNEAIDSLRAAISRAPENGRYHLVLGNVYREANRPEDAEASWTRASELSPNDADPLEALGLAALNANRFTKAVEYLTRARAVDATRHHLVASIGDAHFRATEWDAAIASYREALRLDPSLTRVYFNIGRAYSESERVREAVPWLQRATVAHPDEPAAFASLGYALKFVGRKAEAASAFRTYLSKREDAPDKKDVEDEIYGLVNE